MNRGPSHFGSRHPGGQDHIHIQRSTHELRYQIRNTQSADIALARASEGDHKNIHRPAGMKNQVNQESVCSSALV